MKKVIAYNPIPTDLDAFLKLFGDAKGRIDLIDFMASFLMNLDTSCTAEDFLNPEFLEKHSTCDPEKKKVIQELFKKLSTYQVTEKIHAFRELVSNSEDALKKKGEDQPISGPISVTYVAEADVPKCVVEDKGIGMDMRDLLLFCLTPFRSGREQAGSDQLNLNSIFGQGFFSIFGF